MEPVNKKPAQIIAEEKQKLSDLIRVMLREFEDRTGCDVLSISVTRFYDRRLPGEARVYFGVKIESRP